MIETVISLLKDVTTTGNFYKMVCGVFTKDKTNEYFAQIIAHLNGIQVGIKRLSDNILYAPDRNLGV